MVVALVVALVVDGCTASISGSKNTLLQKLTTLYDYNAEDPILWVVRLFLGPSAVCLPPTFADLQFLVVSFRSLTGVVGFSEFLSLQAAE